VPSLHPCSIVCLHSSVLCLLSNLSFETLLIFCPQVYRILLRHSPVVQPLSVDEAFLDLTSLGFSGDSTEAQQLVTQMRSEIHTATGCTASAGGSVLLACVVEESFWGISGG